MRRSPLLFTALVCSMPLPSLAYGCTPLAYDEPRSRTLHCNKTVPCTRFRASSGRGGGGKGVNCEHGCATEFAPVGSCVGHLIVTNDYFPGVWRSCNETMAVLDIYPPEVYPPTCSGKPFKTIAYPTDATCRVFDNSTMPVGPVSDGEFWQMDCMTSYYDRIPPQLLAVGTTPTGTVSISSLNYTTKTAHLLYEYNSSIGTSPAAATSPTDPNDGIIYFAGYNPKTGQSKVVSFEPRAKLGDWTFPTAVEQPFQILSLMFFQPVLSGCDYQGPNCGVWVLASHMGSNGTGAYLDVGEVLHTGQYNVTSKPFPAGKATESAAYNWDPGNARFSPPDPAAFYLQMEAPDGSLKIVRCSLPGGEIMSFPLDPGYKILAMEFAKGALVAIASKRSTGGSAKANATTYYIVTVARNNGTVTEVGSFVPSKLGYNMLPGVSALTYGKTGMDSKTGAALNVILSPDTPGNEYELVAVDPWAGVVLHRAMLANPSNAAVVQLGWA